MMCHSVTLGGDRTGGKPEQSDSPARLSRVCVPHILTSAVLSQALSLQQVLKVNSPNYRAKADACSPTKMRRNGSPELASKLAHPDRKY